MEVGLLCGAGVKIQVRDLVRVVGTVVPFAPRGGGIRGKFILS